MLGDAVAIRQAGHIGSVGPVTWRRIATADIVDALILHHDNDEMIEIVAW